MVKVKTTSLKNALEQSLLTGDYSKVSLVTSDNVLKIGSVNYEIYDEKYAHSDYRNIYENYLSISIDIVEKDSVVETVVLRDDLLNILSSVKSECVSLSMQEEKYKYYLIINDGKTNYRLPAQDPDLVKFFVDKRLIQDIEDGIKIKTKNLIDAIDRVMYATHNGNYYLILKTIGIIFKDNTIFIAGKSENLTAVYNLKTRNSFRSKKYGIVKLNGRGGITKTAAQTIKKVFGSTKTILFDIVNEGEYKIAIFKSGNTVLTTKIVKEDVYPNVFDNINSLDDKYTIQAKLPKNDIIDVLKSIILIETENKKSYLSKEVLASILKSEYVDHIDACFFFSNNRLTIKPSIIVKGKDVNIEYIGNAIEDECIVKLDAINLMRTLNNIHTDEIIMKFSPDDKKHVYIGSTDNRYSVVMKPKYVKYAKELTKAVWSENKNAIP